MFCQNVFAFEFSSVKYYFVNTRFQFSFLIFQSILSTCSAPSLRLMLRWKTWVWTWVLIEFWTSDNTCLWTKTNRCCMSKTPIAIVQTLCQKNRLVSFFQGGMTHGYICRVGRSPYPETLYKNLKKGTLFFLEFMRFVQIQIKVAQFAKALSLSTYIVLFSVCWSRLHISIVCFNLLHIWINSRQQQMSEYQTACACVHDISLLNTGYSYECVCLHSLHPFVNFNQTLYLARTCLSVTQFSKNCFQLNEKITLLKIMFKNGFMASECTTNMHQTIFQISKKCSPENQVCLSQVHFQVRLRCHN